MKSAALFLLALSTSAAALAADPAFTPALVQPFQAPQPAQQIHILNTNPPAVSAPVPVTPAQAAFERLSGDNLATQTPAQAADLTGKDGTLLVFWRSDCAPCINEMPQLFSYALTHASLKIALVGLDKSDIVRARLADAQPPANVQVYATNTDAKSVLQHFGNDRLALPYGAYAKGNGSVCGAHYGPLGTDVIAQWTGTCI
jgi:hypothetical protein